MENRHDIISRINEKYAAMSKGHKAIATYIMEHYDQAAYMTAAKLGAELGISESTVVRFAAGLGYEGYPQMQQAIAAWVKGKLNTVDGVGAKYAGSTQSEILTSIFTCLTGYDTLQSACLCKTESRLRNNRWVVQ